MTWGSESYTNSYVHHHQSSWEPKVYLCLYIQPAPRNLNFSILSNSSTQIAGNLGFLVFHPKRTQKRACKQASKKSSKQAAILLGTWASSACHESLHVALRKLASSTHKTSLHNGISNASQNDCTNCQKVRHLRATAAALVDKELIHDGHQDNCQQKQGQTSIDATGCRQEAAVECEVDECQEAGQHISNCKNPICMPTRIQHLEIIHCTDECIPWQKQPCSQCKKHNIRNIVIILWFRSSSSKGLPLCCIMIISFYCRIPPSSCYPPHFQNPNFCHPSPNIHHNPEAQSLQIQHPFFTPTPTTVKTRS